MYKQRRRVQDAIRATGMKLVEYKDLTHHLTQYFKCMLAAVKESKLVLQLRGVSMARLQVRTLIVLCLWRARTSSAACALRFQTCLAVSNAARTTR